MNNRIAEAGDIPRMIELQIEKDDVFFKGEKRCFFRYDPKRHCNDIASLKYFRALVVMRHYIKAISDYYFSNVQNAKNVDLFMITPSVSSPMGTGSDSETIPVKLGELDMYLTDSSQFGFEPIVINGIDKVYCYLPSMRGENSDNRHLNQFFHCEMEMAGSLEQLIPIIEGYVKILAKTLLKMQNIMCCLSKDYSKTVEFLEDIVASKKFQSISFDDACTILEKAGKGKFMKRSPSGRDITAQGELEIFKIIKSTKPIWIKYYDRDRVPFYQKPKKDNPGKVLNADLIFPPILKNSFGGEIVGSGQRQDSSVEMVNSLRRQSISEKPYEWYINLRRLPLYRTTSGFGLGIERFIAWALGRESIKEAILYPRIKNVKTYP